MTPKSLPGNYPRVAHQPGLTERKTDSTLTWPLSPRTFPMYPPRESQVTPRTMDFLGENTTPCHARTRPICFRLSMHRAQAGGRQHTVGTRSVSTQWGRQHAGGSVFRRHAQGSGNVQEVQSAGGLGAHYPAVKDRHQET